MKVIYNKSLSYQDLKEIIHKESEVYGYAKILVRKCKIWECHFSSFQDIENDLLSSTRESLIKNCEFFKISEIDSKIEESKLFDMMKESYLEKILNLFKKKKA